MNTLQSLLHFTYFKLCIQKLLNEMIKGKLFVEYKVDLLHPNR